MKYKLIIPGQNSAPVEIIKVIITETTFLFPITTSLCVLDIMYCCGQLSHCVHVVLDIWTFIRFNLIIMFLCLQQLNTQNVFWVIGSGLISWSRGWVYTFLPKWAGVHFYTFLLSHLYNVWRKYRKNSMWSFQRKYGSQKSGLK